MLEKLIHKGGNVNAMDKKDRRPIHWAAFMGEVQNVSYSFYITVVTF